MVTRTFPRQDLEQLFQNGNIHTNDDGVSYVVHEDEGTGDSSDTEKSLGEWHRLVFEVVNDFEHEVPEAYVCWYVDGGSYWKANADESWDDYFQAPSEFPRDNPERYCLTSKDVVTCTRVHRVPVTTYEWMPYPA